jgi:hypothetical protein
MASLSDHLRIVLLTKGEEGYSSFNNYGDVQNANWEIVEAALSENSAITIDTANVTLTDAQQQSLYLNLSGTLTGNRDLILKADQKGFWMVNNGTSGAYTVTIKPSGGTGFALPQGEKTIVFSDGSTAVSVVSSYTAFGPEDIGVTLQGYSAILAALSEVSGAADKLAYFTGASAMSVTDITTFARTLLDDADAATARATLGISMEYLSTTTASGGSTLEITDGFSSDYDEYVIQLIGIRSGTDNQTLLCTLSENGGSSWLGTGYSYSSTLMNASAVTPSGADSALAMNVVVNVGSAAGDAVSGELKLFNVSASKTTLTGQFHGFDSSGANSRITMFGGSQDGSSARVNGVRLACGSAIYGSARLYGIRNS